MPPEATGSTATILTRPDTRSAWVRLVGDIDICAEPMLADVVARIVTAAPRAAVVDLTSVPFVGASFARFLSDLHHALPDMALKLHHPSRLACDIVRITHLDTFVTLNDRDPPSTPERLRPGPAVRRDGTSTANRPRAPDRASRKPG